MSGEWYTLMTIAGPVLLAVVLLWAVTHNRRSRREIERTEAATREVQAAEEARLRAMDGKT